MTDLPTLPLSYSGKPPLEVALAMAVDAGQVLLDHFQDVKLEVSTKSRGNVVTAADYAAEKLVLERLREEYPEHAILSEEAGAETRVEPTPWLWVIDPLDGSRNFASGIGHFAVNIALCFGLEPVVGVTYDPVRKERFWAVHGRGAWLNDGKNEKRLQASSSASVADSVLGVDLGYSDMRGKAMLSLAHDIFPGFACVRLMGSGALGMAYAASGRYDLYVHNYLYPWDVAPGILMVREAGGAITGREGEPVSINGEGVICGAPDACAEFLKLAAGRAWRESPDHAG